ncbi:MAG: ATP-binding protein [Eubacteriales bacterium]|nr:ATP-binding protein [Eubacteriales bacterium]
MIRKFTCSNFKNITVQNLEFERINILIGPNNAGKSNFIRALSFCANMVNGDQVEKTGLLSEIKRNGWENILNRQAGKEGKREITFDWTLEFPGRNLEYQLNIHAGKNSGEFYITHESLQNAEKDLRYERPFNYFDCHDPDRGKGVFSSAAKRGQNNNRTFVNLSSEETVLLQFEKAFFDNPKLFSEKDIRERTMQILNEMRLYFTSFYSYSSAAFDLSQIRELKDRIDGGERLLKNAGNFVNVYDYCRRKDPDFEKIFKRRLKLLAPELEDIQVEEGLGKLGMLIKKGSDYFTLSEVSDGTVKMLVLILLLSITTQNGLSLLAVDEPEMNLHPAWQKLLAKQIQLSNNFRQCFISTHSPDFLDEFTEGFKAGEIGIFVFEENTEKGIKKLNYRDAYETIKHL